MSYQERSRVQRQCREAGGNFQLGARCWPGFLIKAFLLEKGGYKSVSTRAKKIKEDKSRSSLWKVKGQSPM